MQVLLARERQGHDVFALLEIRRVRPGAREDHRVLAGLGQARIVPAPAQVVALLIVGRGAEPGRADIAVRQRLEDDEALFPVRLVVVRAVERGAPVVHRVEEQVVEDDPRPVAQDPSVVVGLRVLGADVLVLDRGRGRRPARHAAAQEQRRDEAGIHQPRRQADPGQPAGGVELGRARTVPPAGQLHRVHRLGHEPQVLGVPGRRIVDGAQTFEVQLGGRDGDPGLAQGRALQEIAGLDVGKNSSPWVKVRIGSNRRSRARSASGSFIATSGDRRRGRRAG